VEPAESAHVIKLSAFRIEPAAGIVVVGPEGGHDLRDGKSGAGNLHRIEEHLILHRLAAKPRIVSHARDGLVLALDDPVLDGLELHR
jgi:hypothetical protein